MMERTTIMLCIKLFLFTASAGAMLIQRRKITHTQSQQQTTQTLRAAEVSTISSLRKEYSSQGLEIDHNMQEKGPFDLFSIWLDEACKANVIEPNAMCLSTCLNNRPSARYVLLKGYDTRGFVWYTNYNSRKSDEAMASGFAALTFWWGDLERSVRIEGEVEKVSEEESDAYFNSRPRGSQIGAWSSNQSSKISSREDLEQQEKDIIARFESETEIVPRPPHWGGFRLVPDRMEFWKGRQSRLHDRIVFEREDDVSPWTTVRLQP